MKSIRCTFSLVLVLLAALALIVQPARAQSDQALAVVMTADGPIMPPMLEYISRGIKAAEQHNAEVLIIQLNTPGGLINVNGTDQHLLRSLPQEAWLRTGLQPEQGEVTVEQLAARLAGHDEAHLRKVTALRG